MTQITLSGQKSLLVASYPQNTFINISVTGPGTLFFDSDPNVLDNPAGIQGGQAVNKNAPWQGWWLGDLYAIGSTPNLQFNITAPGGGSGTVQGYLDQDNPSPV